MEAELTRKDSAPEEISDEPLMGGGRSRQGWADGRGGSGGGCVSPCWKGPSPPLWINHSCVWRSHSQTWLCMSHLGIQLKGGSEDFPAGPVVESPPAHPGDTGMMLAGPWATPGLTLPWRTPGQQGGGKFNQDISPAGWGTEALGSWLSPYFLGLWFFVRGGRWLHLPSLCLALKTQSREGVYSLKSHLFNLVSKGRPAWEGRKGYWRAKLPQDNRGGTQGLASFILSPHPRWNV